MVTDEKEREKIACEATYIANELVRQLAVPSLIVEDSQERLKKPEFNFLKEGAIRNFCMLGVIVNLYRVIELRDNFLLDILFSEDELRHLGFPSVEEFLGGQEKMKFLRILRHQFAGHATAKSATAKSARRRKAGKLLSGELLGRALKETGLTKFPEFTKRLRDEMPAQLEGFIAQMRQKFPVVDEFVRGDYALDVEKGQLGR